MHYKDGTPATLGDIIQHDSGSVGIVVGGTIGNDYCSTQVVMFRGARQGWSHPAPSFSGVLRNETGEIVQTAAVCVSGDCAIQTRECLKIGHVDLGHG